MSSLILFEDRAGRRNRLAGFLKDKAGTYHDLPVPGRPTHRLVIWTGRTATTAGYADLGGDDFIAFAGSFFFAGNLGLEAAKAFHQEFDPESFDWSGCSGQFVLVIGKAGQVHMVNDGLAAWKLFTDQDQGYVSGGFLEALLLTDRPAFDAQGVYEYVFAGFALGETTFVSDIRAVLPNRLLSLAPDGRVTATALDTPIRREPVTRLPIDAMAARQTDCLERRFEAYRAVPDGALISSISGGFDSRLMVSSFVRAGLKPRLFVYGPPHDPDVICSRAIADYLGLPFDHVDKEKQRREEKPAKPDIDTLLFYFDGWKDDGLLGFDIDLQDRMARGARGSFMANGKCGEIYRHYFYQHVGRFGTTSAALMRSAFCRPIPGLTTKALDVGAFNRAVAASFEALTGFGDRRVYQENLDYLYPKIRMCHDAGRDITINHRFSHALYPFVEAALCGPALAIPYDQKIHGRLEARMIARQDAGLAALPNAYGYDMLAGPGLKYRLATAASYYRPSWMRYLLPRLKTRLMPPLSAEQLAVAGLPMLDDQSQPYMRRYFKMGTVPDLMMTSRILALELLAQRFHFQP